MKKRKYEKMTFSFIVSGIIWFLELALIIQLYKIKITDYHKITMMFTNSKEGIVIVNVQEKKMLYSNTYFYWKNKKVFYKIMEEKVLDDDKNYQICLKLNKINNKKNEIIEISIKNKKISMMDGIIKSWDGDKNNKS